MRKPNRILLMTVSMFILIQSISLACTSAIVSGKYTADGRPILFKHRDSDFEDNKLVFFKDGKYEYIGLVNSKDTLNKQVWGGCNSVGFAIMNTASYNLKADDDTASVEDREGIVMKMALMQCETIEDFEKMLDNMPKPWGVQANFGVIDAYGGAAYYETGNYSYKKVDVNDPMLAPFGYIIRTNYSFDGKEDEGYGYIRYLTAEELIYNAAAAKSLNTKFFLQDVSRSLKHSLMNTDLGIEPKYSEKENGYEPMNDYIVRNGSVSSILIQGVKKGEAPTNATIWTILGFQFTTVAVPTWLFGGEQLPELVVKDESGNAPLCDKSLILKNRCFPIKRGSGGRYMDLAQVINKEGNGYWQKLEKVENEVLSNTESKLKEWREGKFTKEKIQKYYKWLDEFISSKYREFFNI